MNNVNTVLGTVAVTITFDTLTGVGTPTYPTRGAQFDVDGTLTPGGVSNTSTSTGAPFDGRFKSDGTAANTRGQGTWIRPEPGDGDQGLPEQLGRAGGGLAPARSRPSWRSRPQRRRQVRREMVAQLAEVEEAIDTTQQVAARHVIVEIEGAEESVSVAISQIHHPDAPVVPMGSLTGDNDAQFFSKLGRLLTDPAGRFG